jgi:predicted signal transduction protein with EAL and GGDEF domain
VRARFADLSADPGASVTMELRVRHKNGSWRWVEGTATNLLDDATVQAIVINYRDVSERRALQERLTHQAFHDPLTNLANRALLKDRIEHALVRRIQQRQSSMAVLFVDLDDFKTINDSLGHSMGDLLLIAVADRMRRCLRPADTLARAWEATSSGFSWKTCSIPGMPS